MACLCSFQFGDLFEEVSLSQCLKMISPKRYDNKKKTFYAFSNSTLEVSIHKDVFVSIVDIGNHRKFMCPFLKNKTCLEDFVFIY